MPAFVYTAEEPPKFELIPPGTYPFEIIGADQGLGKGKTATCSVITVKLRIFEKPDFATPIGQFSENLTFPECREVPGLLRQADADNLNAIFHGKLNQFVRCTGIRAEVGQQLELDGDSVIGLRGWARVGKRTITSQKDGSKREVNEVTWWVTDRGILPPNRSQAEPETETDNNPGW